MSIQHLKTILIDYFSKLNKGENNKTKNTHVLSIKILWFGSVSSWSHALKA